MGDLSRKERERLRHRREILAAAERLFSQKGYHGTTVQEIAQEAEFSVGALYNMFENKDDLYLQLVEMRAEEYFESVEKRLAQVAAPLGKIRTVIATKLDFFREHKAFFSIFCDIGTEDPPHPPVGASKRLMEQYLEYQGNLQEVFREGIREGVFVDEDPVLMALCLEGISNAAIARWVQAHGAGPAEAQPEEIERLLFHGVLAGGKHR